MRKDKLKPVRWDFSEDEFTTTQRLPLTMLNSYDVISIDKLSDSLLVIDLAVFKGWKALPLKFTDTLKLIDNVKVLDALGNQTRQMLSYSKSREIFFQLNLSNQGTKAYYKYDGKLFIDSEKLRYFCDHLYMK